MAVSERIWLFHAMPKEQELAEISSLAASFAAVCLRRGKDLTKMP